MVASYAREREGDDANYQPKGLSQSHKDSLGNFWYAKENVGVCKIMAVVLDIRCISRDVVIVINAPSRDISYAMLLL